MKCLALVLVLVTGSLSPAQNVKSSYDKFKDLTNVETEKYSIGWAKNYRILVPEMEMVAVMQCPGKRAVCGPRNVGLIFIAHTSDWQMSRHTQGILLIDGQRAPLGAASYDGQVLSVDDLREYISFNIKPSLVKQLARAKKVELQLGNYEFDIPYDNLGVFEELGRHLATTASKQ